MFYLSTDCEIEVRPKQAKTLEWIDLGDSVANTRMVGELSIGLDPHHDKFWLSTVPGYRDEVLLVSTLDRRPPVDQQSPPRYSSNVQFRFLDNGSSTRADLQIWVDGQHRSQFDRKNVVVDLREPFEPPIYQRKRRRLSSKANDEYAEATIVVAACGHRFTLYLRGKYV